MVARGKAWAGQLAGLISALLVGCGSSPAGAGSPEQGPDAGGDAGPGDAAVDVGEPIFCDKADGLDCPGNDYDPLSWYETPEGKGKPPPPPSQPHPVEGAPPAVFAVQKWFLGDTDRQGSPSDDAWKLYGFDLDGWSSDVGFFAHCKAVGGGYKADIRLDGVDGVDNSFGRNVMTILQTFTMSPSDDATQAVASGRGTLLFSLDALGEASQQTGLTARLLPAAGAIGSHGQPLAPTEAQWADGSYAWRPIAKPPTPAPLHAFAGSYVAGDVLVLAPRTSLTIELPWLFPFGIELHGLIVSGKLSPDRRQITDGKLGGMIPSAWVRDTLPAYLGRVSPSLCDKDARKGITDQILAASDSLLDGTQDPTRDCEAISIGIGFEGKAALLGSQAPALPAPPAYPCGNGQP